MHINYIKIHMVIDVKILVIEEALRKCMAFNALFLIIHQHNNGNSAKSLFCWTHQPILIVILLILITYHVHARSYIHSAADFYVDPIGTPIVNTATARAESTQIYSMKMNKVAPNNTIDFVGRFGNKITPKIF